MPVRAVLFDFDGTLVDSERDIVDAVNATFVERGHAPFDRATASSWIGHGASHLIAEGLRARGLDPAEHLSAFRARLLEIYAPRALATTVPFPGAEETLLALRARGLPLGLVTNKPREIALDMLTGLGWADTFGVVIGGEDLPTRKPDPAPVRVACERLGVPPIDALFVGDTEMDFQAARGAGCVVVGVSFGFRAGADLRALGADHVIDALPALLDLTS